MPIERRFLPILALVGAVIVTHQGLDLLSVSQGADLATPTGRLGLVAILWTRGPVLLAADVLLLLAASLSAWSRCLMLLGIVHLLAGAAALAEAPFFLTDAAHLAGTIAVPELPSFRITVFRILAALVVLGAGAVVAGASLIGLHRPNRQAG
jgi:hypothetical protein